MRLIQIIKKPSIILGFFYNHWISIALVLFIYALIQQAFFVADFPNTLEAKQHQANQILTENKQLQKQNTLLKYELEAENDPAMEIIESKARYQFGLVKKGETFWQIFEDTKIKPETGD